VFEDDLLKYKPESTCLDIQCGAAPELPFRHQDNTRIPNQNISS